MGKKLYVGNLSFKLTEQGLRQAFEPYGEVMDAVLITDKMTGRPRGFGFVEMADDEGARQAIAKLHETELDGRRIVVNEARPQKKDMRH